MEIKARIPGTIIAVNAAVGDTVKARGVLATLEAMKMEQPIACPIDGVVLVSHLDLDGLDHTVNGAAHRLPH